ncbi:hypothetical protein FRC05_008720, partial [Tulasnella sp. 425]
MTALTHPTSHQRTRTTQSSSGLASASVYDASGRLIVYRAYGNSETVKLNHKTIRAAATLENSTAPEFQAGKHQRGIFSRPLHSKYLEKTLEQAATRSKDLQPIIELVEAIFKARFPRLDQYYLS